ncbi:diphosphomevalonate decarboxylase [Reticulomyxa filosa]|uniref:Diphosphomevalonate decarboxylase n=1 Tax=Reticulomyxa filosa TaxID=46433 RepID=X6NEE3_RETFI|nr:diphosphomevalonate decarboxylase [Reticulomyxa filosa]|eukprot:ETO23717.1 diphosphomevalonate decarboxylase [Reticulomyxa filosa]
MKERLRNMRAVNSLCKKAIDDRDFDLLCEVMMKDSNQLHSVCLDSWPPIHYLNDTSFRIIDLVHLINDKFATANNHYFKYMCGYTFHAGPNAAILVRHPRYVDCIVKLIEDAFVGTDTNLKVPCLDPLKLREECPPETRFSLPRANNDKLTEIVPSHLKRDGIKQIILTKIGGGAKITEFKIEPCHENRSKL